jgi:Negative regulator of sigma F
MTTPPKLRETIARDLKPARPLRSPWIRALTLLPIAAVVVIAIPSLHVFRSDLAALGIVRTWGFSFGQALAGVLIVATALRESIPGRTLSRAGLLLTFAIGLVVPFVVILLTATRFDIGSAPGQGFAEGASCFRLSAMAAVPALVAAAILTARALPVRPLVAGALYGLGCGLMADAGLRLYCDYTSPLHVLLAHGGAIGASLVGGVVIGSVSRRW